MVARPSTKDFALILSGYFAPLIPLLNALTTVQPSKNAEAFDAITRRIGTHFHYGAGQGCERYEGGGRSPSVASHDVIATEVESAHFQIASGWVITAFIVYYFSLTVISILILTNPYHGGVTQPDEPANAGSVSSGAQELEELGQRASIDISAGGDH